MSSMLAAWGAVLDRSIKQMAAASADARTFDRRLIAKVSDVWDNNTFPFFAAAAARTSRRREQLANDGFRWMADFGSARREWVIEQGSIADAEYESAEVREVAGGLIGRVARSGVTPARWRASELPPESELLLVEFSVGRPPHDSSVVVQLASPPEHDGSTWVRRGLEVEKPHRFRLDLAAFRGSTGIRVAGERSEVEAVVLRDDNLAVSSAGR